MNGVLERWFGAAAEGPAPVAAKAEAATRGRRDRLAGVDDAVASVLAQKVLHGWLQNRHQTMFPLTVNLRTLDAGQVAALAGMVAVAGHATGEPDGEARARTGAWFAQVGADAPGRAALEAAQASPPPLHAVLDAIRDAGLAAHGYVAALVAIDQRDPAAAPFLDYLAARLALPVTVLRSAQRRYRR